jgi:hypothetical protein
MRPFYSFIITSVLGFQFLQANCVDQLSRQIDQSSLKNSREYGKVFKNRLNDFIVENDDNPYIEKSKKEKLYDFICSTIQDTILLKFENIQVIEFAENSLNAEFRAESFCISDSKSCIGNFKYLELMETVGNLNMTLALRGLLLQGMSQIKVNQMIAMRDKMMRCLAQSKMPEIKVLHAPRLKLYFKNTEQLQKVKKDAVITVKGLYINKFSACNVDYIHDHEMSISDFQANEFGLENVEILNFNKSSQK